MNFLDYFSTQSREYARYRPNYPRELFAFLAALTDRHELAWDCGTGNGQAAVGLTNYYARVIATDPSREQIAHALPHARVTYLTARAEDPPAMAQSADLVTVAQALHWIDLDCFYPAVKQVLMPEGVFAAWGYGRMQVTPEVNTVVREYYADIVGRYWPPQRKIVESGYTSLPFPFDEISAPPFTLIANWSRAQLLGYLDTWSATRRFIEAHGTHPIERIHARLVAAWGDADTRTVAWPLFLRVGRNIG